MLFPRPQNNDKAVILVQLGFVCFLVISQFGFYYTSPSDFVAHVKIFDKCVNGGGQLPGNPTYYILLYIGQIFLSTKKHLVLLSLTLCSLAKIATYLITTRIINNKLKGNTLAASWLAGLVCISFSIYNPLNAYLFGYLYLGTIPPNIYHNPTTILCMPFVLLCYESIIKENDTLTSTFWAALCAATKPSFLISIGPALGALWILTRKIQYLKQALIISIIVAVQFTLIFIMGIGTPNESKSFVTFFTPLKFLTTYTSAWTLPFSMLASFALPLWYFIRTKFEPNLALLNFFFAGAIAIFVHEAGPREDDGNFIWQWIIASFIVFLEAAAFMYNKRNKFGAKILTLHALSGIAYVIHSILSNTYK